MPKVKVPKYVHVLNDREVQQSIECVGTYLLGQHQARRVRDVSGVLYKYAEIGVTCWSYWAMLLKVLLLTLNVVAIFFAYLTYQSDKVKDWNFAVPTRIVAWLEFLGIIYFLAWFLYRLLCWAWAGLRELRSPHECIYERNLEFCTASRKMYKAGMRLEFNLLMFLRYISPPAVMAAIGRARRKVYARYGTRVHHANCCLDVLFGCCFYGRLCVCSLFQSSLVLLFMGISLLAVLIKILQLRFLGTTDIRDWTVTEILLFAQFVVNLACLDNRETCKRKAKLELLFYGADAQEATGERTARKLLEDLALLVMRYRHSWLTALVIHHSITSEDISYLYVHDELEEEKPRNIVRHQYHSKLDGTGIGGGSSGGGTGSGSGSTSNGGESATAPPSVSDWQQRPPPPRFGPGGSHYIEPTGMFPAQVVVEIGPHGAGTPRGGRHSFQTELSPQRLASPGAPVTGDRFPYDFYTHGRACGVPLRGSASPVLTREYEHRLYNS